MKKTIILTAKGRIAFDPDKVRSALDRYERDVTNLERRKLQAHVVPAMPPFDPSEGGSGACAGRV